MGNHNYGEELDSIVKDMDGPLGRLDFMQAMLKDRIEELTELRAEVLERADKLACSIDFNRRWPSDD